MRHGLLPAQGSDDPVAPSPTNGPVATVDDFSNRSVTGPDPVLPAFTVPFDWGVPSAEADTDWAAFSDYRTMAYPLAGSRVINDVIGSGARAEVGELFVMSYDPISGNPINQFSYGKVLNQLLLPGRMAQACKVTLNIEFIDPTPDPVNDKMNHIFGLSIGPVSNDAVVQAAAWFGDAAQNTFGLDNGRYTAFEIGFFEAYGPQGYPTPGGNVGWDYYLRLGRPVLGAFDVSVDRNLTRRSTIFTTPFTGPIEIPWTRTPDAIDDTARVTVEDDTNWTAFNNGAGVFDGADMRVILKNLRASAAAAGTDSTAGVGPLLRGRLG